MGHIGIHARQEQRCIGHACDPTFSATTDTVFSRLLSAVETVVLDMTWLGHEGPLPTLVAALEGTGGRALHGGPALNQATCHWHTDSPRKRAITVWAGHRVYESRVD